MNKFKSVSRDKISSIPQASGVYCFKDKKETLYIGKAINLRKRIKDHFKKSGFRDHLFMAKVEKIGYLQTNSEIEALILEASLIKKRLPKYNVAWKDGKNYLSVGFSKEKLPRVFLGRQPKPNVDFLGPFTDAKALKTALRLLRRAFPFYTAKKHGPKPCQYCEIHLCPGPNPDPAYYRKNIKNLRSVLKGKRTALLRKLKAEMAAASQNQDFEKAAQVRNQVFALESVFAHKPVFETRPGENRSFAELQKSLGLKNPIARIEAYDVSNIQGQQATGSMVVFKNGRPDKSQYRLFKIRLGETPNDTAMIKETLERRLRHRDWPSPQLILIDGGRAQLQAALKAKKTKLIKVMALAKKHNELFIEGSKEPLLLTSLARPVFNLILRLRDEAHRFARNYHLKLRRLAFLDQS